jgi:hypothetical protein
MQSTAGRYSSSESTSSSSLWGERSYDRPEKYCRMFPCLREHFRFWCFSSTAILPFTGIHINVGPCDLLVSWYSINLWISLGQNHTFRSYLANISVEWTFFEQITTRIRKRRRVLSTRPSKGTSSASVVKRSGLDLYHKAQSTDATIIGSAILNTISVLKNKIVSSYYGLVSHDRLCLVRRVSIEKTSRTNKHGKVLEKNPATKGGNDCPSNMSDTQQTTCAL